MNDFYIEVKISYLSYLGHGWLQSQSRLMGKTVAFSAMPYLQKWRQIVVSSNNFSIFSKTLPFNKEKLETEG